MNADDLIAILREAAARGNKARPYVDIQVRDNTPGITLFSFFNGRSLQKIVPWIELTEGISPIDTIEACMTDMRKQLIQAVADGD
jgi:hypothetical protein